MNYDVYNKPQLSQNDVLATSPPTDIMGSKVESEINSTITYKLKYNTNQDYSHVPLNWNNNKKKSFQSYFFCDVDGKKICQFYETDKDGKGTICNACIVRSKKDTKGKSLARLLKKHLLQEHYFPLGSKTLDMTILQYFYPLRKDFKALERILKRRSNMNVTVRNTLMQASNIDNSEVSRTREKKIDVNFSNWEAFCMNIRIIVCDHGSYDFVENKDLAIFHNYIGSRADPTAWKKSDVPAALSQSANIIMEKIKLFFTETQSMVDKISVISTGLSRYELYNTIPLKFAKKLGVIIPWVSLESYSWKSSNGDDCTCIILNFLNSKLEKQSLPILFQNSVTDDKGTLIERFTETSTFMGMRESITTCFSDSASNAMGLTNDFLLNLEYTACNSHDGCLIQHLQDLANAIIEDIGSLFQSTADKSSNFQNLSGPDIGNDESQKDTSRVCFDLSSDSDIINRLFMLSRKLDTTTSLKELFLKNVGSLPCAKGPNRWNSTFYRLQHFLRDANGYREFSEQLNGIHEEQSFKFDYSENDIILSKIFYDLLVPFEAINKLLSQNAPLSICKIPFMLHIRDIMENARNELEGISKKPIVFQKSDALFTKYLNESARGKNLTYLAGLFFVDSEQIVLDAEERGIDWLQSLSDLAYQLLNCEFIDRDGPNYKKSHGETYLEVVCGPNNFPPESHCMSKVETIDTIETVLKSNIQNDLEDFYTFLFDEIEGIVTSIASEMGLEIQSSINLNKGFKIESVRETVENILLYGENYKNEQIFIVRYKASLEILRLYLDNIRKRKVNGKILPVILEYLLSINVTSIKNERNISNLNQIFGTDRYLLKDQFSFNELLIRQIMKTFDVDCSFNNLREKGITGLLSDAV